MSETRWNSLVEESTSVMATEGAKNSASQTSSFSFLGLFVFLLIALIAAFVINSSTKTEALRKASGTESLTVLQPKIVPEIDESVAAALRPEDFGVGGERPTVTAKRAPQSSKYFGSEDTADLQEPFLHTENGQSFSDFAKTLDSGRETYTSERPMNSKPADLNYLKSDLKRRGLGLDDFVESYGLSVSDKFVDSWTTEITQKKASSGELKKPDGVSDSEVRMLAQEALQTLSTTCDAESANSVLREILAARTEAARIGLEVPSLTEDQLKAIKFWSNSKAFKTSTIAKTLLSR